MKQKMSTQKTLTILGLISVTIFLTAMIVNAIMGPTPAQLAMQEEQARVSELLKADAEARANVATTITQKATIGVSYKNVKLINGKYRWFYLVRNTSDIPFNGTVTIDATNAAGKSIYGKTFTMSLVPNGSSIMYFDTHSKPASIAGDVYGITGFTATYKNN